MVTEEEIAEAFAQLNLQVTDKSSLSRSVELCKKYNFDAETFVEEWWAFAASKLQGVTMPNMVTLDALDKDQLKKANRISKKRLATEELPDRQTKWSKPRTSTIIPEPLKSVHVQQRPQTEDVTSQNGSISTILGEKKYTVSILHNVMDSVLYMNQTPVKKGEALSDLVDSLGKKIIENYHLKLTPGYLTRTIGKVITYGRIASDSNSKLNSTSLLLEGSRETDRGKTVGLNPSKLNSYAFFPGQTVAIQGETSISSHHKSVLAAEKVFGEVKLGSPIGIPVPETDLRLMIASGPFTLQDDLTFEPLSSLLDAAQKFKPALLILMGPFFDAKHSSQRNLPIYPKSDRNQRDFDTSLSDDFDTILKMLLEKIGNSLDFGTKVVLVSSSKDVLQDIPVFPTPAYKVDQQFLAELGNNIICVQDPCTIQMDGLVISATTADILLHLSTRELFLDKTTSQQNRMGRLASHILDQGSFYPIYPPDIRIDQELYQKYGLMEVKPHLLILPSNLKNFSKEVKDCLVVNPERLTKGNCLGTYAKIEISPGNTESICGRSSCVIESI